MSSESDNPFAPPATRDLDAGGDAGASAATDAALSEESLRELVAGGIWVRWLARVTALSIALGFLGAVVTLARARAGVDAIASAGAVVVGTMFAALFLVVLRRYAAAADRLARGNRAAAEHVIDAQAAYFKMNGALTLAAIGLVVLGVIAVIVVSAMSRGGRG